MGGRVEAIQLLASGILGSGYILHGRLFCLFQVDIDIRYGQWCANNFDVCALAARASTDCLRADRGECQDPSCVGGA